MTHLLIDLFCGAGGMTIGFKQHGFDSIWAIDSDNSAVATYAKNFGRHVVCADIERWLETENVPQADVVVGGPPCQGFSQLNRSKANDPRRALWRPYMEVVRRSGARIFVIENVPALLKSSEGEELISFAKSLGFMTVQGVVNAADYGVPQTRKRALIIGWRQDQAFAPQFPPAQTRGQPGKGTGLPDWATVRDAIADLPPPEGQGVRSCAAPLDLHFGRQVSDMSEKRYRAVPPGGNRYDLRANAPHLTPKCWINKKPGTGTDLFGRLWWDRPAGTIRTDFKPEKGRFLHPEAHRVITLREATRLMSFPDDFEFVGSKTAIAKQIGNAVPPLLSAAIAKTVAAMLADKRMEESEAA